MKTLPATLAVLGSLFSATAALSQVTPAEPFGGRPFGAATAPVPVPAPVPAAPAPVVVQPGAGPVVVQAAPVPAPAPVVAAPAPQVQAPAPAPANVAGPSGRPTSTVNAAVNASAPATGAAPAPASMTPPFTASRAPGQAPAASAPPPPPVKGLPADAPRIVISGSVYSPSSGQRMVIANGQVVREGAEVASGVTLEEVRPESAVLGFRGNRYNVFF